jgi:membrane protein
MRERLDRLRRRWPVLDVAMAVTERFGAVGGGPLATSIGLAAFLSLFPLLLVAIAVIGFVSAGSADFTADVIEDLGLTGQAADLMEEAIASAEGSRRAASVVGVLGLLWSGLGVVGSLQTGINAAWQSKGRGMKDRAFALLWLIGAGLLVLSTLSLGPLLHVLPGLVAPLTVLVGVGLNVVIFLWTFTVLGNQSVGWRVHLPGAVLAGIGFEILKVLGATVVPRSVASSSAMYGTLGVVFAILAWLLLYGRLVMYAAVLNVVRYEREAGTVTIEVEVPRVDGEVPLSGTRGGAVEETAG